LVIIDDPGFLGQHKVLLFSWSVTLKKSVN